MHNDKKASHIIACEIIKQMNEARHTDKERYTRLLKLASGKYPILIYSESRISKKTNVKPFLRIA